MEPSDRKAVELGKKLKRKRRKQLKKRTFEEKLFDTIFDWKGTSKNGYEYLNRNLK